MNEEKQRKPEICEPSMRKELELSVFDGPAAQNKNRVRASRRGSLYKENHSLGEWFKKAYGDE